MLREEQIEIRRQRAKAGRYHIKNLGKNRVFSDYAVSNPQTGGAYAVAIRGFDTGDNTCTCPDFKANTLGTCKHIEAVLEELKDDNPAHVRKKKAAVVRPEVYLHYGEALQLGIHLPPRHTDKLAAVAKKYFDDKGLWSGRGRFEDLIADVEKVPEEVTVHSDALDFLDRELERIDMRRREDEWLAQLAAGTLDLNLLSVPLYDYQTRGALFLACRGRSILGDDMGLGKCVGADTPVFVNGAIETAERVWERYAGTPSSDGEGEWAAPTTPLVVNAIGPGGIHPARIVRLYRQRIDEPVRRLVLDDGSELTVTRRHKLLGRDGWTNRLQVGDVACVPRRLAWQGTPVDPDLTELLAWQISEGYEQPDRATATITQADVARLERLREVAIRFGDRHRVGLNSLTISRPAGKAAYITVSSKPYREFLTAFGYEWGHKSAGKKIPDRIVSADDATVQLFLRHYFAAEGGVSRRQRLVEIVSASRWLMLQLRTMLRRFGIWLRVKRRQKRATNGTGIRREYQIGTLGGNAVRLFRDLIGFADEAKQQALAEVTAVRANTNVEGVPVADLVAALAESTGLPQRHFGVGTQYFYSTQNLSRDTTAKVTTAIDAILSGERLTSYATLRKSKWTAGTLTAYRRLDREALVRARDQLSELCERDVFYARVESVTDEQYRGWVYDYEVEGHHNYVAADVLCHNTIQTLAAVELLARERGIGRVLVVAPASVKYQWEGEIRKFTRRAVQVIEGGPDDRQDQYAAPTFYRLVNYEQVVRDRDAINAWNPDLIVLDEAQRIKNWESKTSRAVKKLVSRYAIVLTGTPLENKLEELYSIVQFVDERRFGPAFQFLHDHRVLDDKGNLTGYRNLDTIRERLEPIFLRRTRGEVLTELPARTDNTVFVELSEEQRKPYEEQRTALARLLTKNFLTDLDRKRILACLSNLRLICDSTFLFDKTTHHSPKLDELSDLLPELLSGGPHKLVVFSQWETMLNLAASTLERKGVGYALLHGGLSGKDRKAALERFKTDPKCRVFLSTDAGGVGLNLQMADTVVNLELPWNPAVLEQRIARVHRMGQERPVRVINLVTRGTIEEQVLRTLERKQGLFAGVFDGEEDEIAFAAVNPGGFLDAVREMIGEKRADPVVESVPPPPPVVPALDAGPTLLPTAVQMLESLAELLANPDAQKRLTAEERRRIAAAVEKLGE